MANEHSQIVPSMQPTSTVADFKFWCQKVLPLVYDDSLSYNEVLNKMVVYLNQVIDNINADTANVAELEDDFLLLQTYVNNFFDDIDQLVTYAERAEAAETAALSSAASAAESASNSATSASNAAGSASTAASMATTALNAKDAAVAAKTAAETALANAQTAATNAAASATAASGSATNAAASAASALQNFQLSDAARTAAQSAASSAESDAEDAADSAAEAAAAVDTIVNGLGTIAKTIENVPVAHVDDALASIPKKLAVDIVPVQSGSGDPSPENVRPITGWTGVNVTREGKNLIKYPYRYGTRTLNGVTFTVSDDGTITVTGTPTDTASFAIVSPQYNPELNKLEGKRVTLSGCPSGGSVDTYYINGFRLRNNGTLSATDTGSTNTFIWSTGGLDFNISINIKVGTVIPEGGLVFKPQLEIAESASQYEKYQATTIQIAFPVEAGTVYGGTITNDGIEWKLRINRVSKKLSEVITSYNSARATFYGTVNDKIDGNSPILSSEYAYERNGGYGVSEGCIGDSSLELKRIFIKDTRYSTVASFIDSTAQGNVQICYELATPIEYTLTESQVVTLLNGINNVWADTGNINTLEYFTNAENYVTSQIDLAKALIAPVLKEMKADTALVANDFRIVGNTLYRITGNISSGGTLTPNTNCVATTVGAILKSLLSA